MTISAGAVVNGLGDANCVAAHCNTFIGQTAGSTGTLTVTGAGTTASFGGTFIVGNASVSTVANGGFNFGTPGGTATGTVNVLSGAALNTYAAALGNIPVSAASLGTEHAIAHAAIDGTNSIWTVSSNPVTGANAGINMAGAPNATATIDVTNGGKLVITGANSFLTVGDAGSGTLTIGGAGVGNFGQVTLSGGMTVGNEATGVGTVTISAGSGQSTLSAGFLTVGNASTALSTFTVNAGGVFNQTADTFGVAIGQQSGAKGAIVINGGQFNVNGLNSAIGVGNNGTGSLSVTNGGTLTLSSISGGIGVGQGLGSKGDVTVDGGQISINGSNAFFGVGGSGTGTLTIINGGTVSVANLGVGSVADGMGTVTVGNGSGQSVLTVTTGLGVGNASTANSQLIVNGGGTVNATGANGVAIGNSQGSQGSVLVDGGQLSVAAGLGVGNQGTGSLTIRNGGQVSAADVGLGGTATALGTVTVGNGTGQSVLTVTHSMGVGNSSAGNSQLTVNSGGAVNVTGVNGLGVAGSAGSQGSVLVDGGQLNVNGANAFLGVGNGGTGSLTVINGGTVSAVNLGLGNQSTGVGTVTVGNGSGQSVITVTNSVGVGNSSTANSQLTVNAGGSFQLTGGGIGIANSQGSHGSVLIDGGQLSVSGAITVGNNGSGTLNVTSGSSVTTGQLVVAGGAGSTGVVNIVGTTSGPQTVLTVNGPTNTINGTNPLAVGNWGNGTMTVSNGAIVNVAIGNANCGVVFCGVGVGVFAGSTGHLTLTDPGTTINASTNFILGNAAVSTNPPSNFAFGTPGGTTNATLEVLNGATLNTYAATVSTGPSGPNTDGSEHTIAHIIIDGPGSSWNVASDPVNPNNDQAFIGVAPRANATALIEITNGGQLTITGSGSNPQPQINLTGTGAQAGGSSTVKVDGAGSAIVFNGDSGLVQLGRNGGTAELDITNGGQVYGGGSNGLTGMNVGRVGSNATLLVDGAGSSLTLSGVTSAVNGNTAGGGAGMTVGREAGGIGAVTVTNGGSILMRDGGQNATSSGVGMLLGRDIGSSGSLTVSGASSAVTIEQTSAGSTANPGFTIGASGSGTVLLTAGGAISISNAGSGGGGITLGRDAGSTGSLTVSGAGSSLTIQQTNVLSTVGAGMTIGQSGSGTAEVTAGGAITISNAGTGGGGITIARNAGSTGSLTVSGTGSSVTVTGTGTGTAAFPAIIVGRAGDGQMVVTDHATVTVNGPSERQIIVGNAPGGTGSLTVSNGAQITASWFGVGNNGGSGYATIDGATVVLNGVAFNPSDSSLFGGSIRVGRGTGSVGTLDVTNQAHIVLDTATAGASINLGGTNTLMGGDGTLNMSGGSTITFGGSNASPLASVNIGHSGTGTVTMTGASTISMPADGRVVLGNTASGNGTLQMDGGSSLNTGAIVVGNNGVGSLTVDGGSTIALPANGSVIVGATATGVGTVLVTGGSSIQAGALFGIGHNGISSTGGSGTVIVDDPASSITAGTVAIGANGCLAGNGVVHANVVMDGPSANVGACPPAPDTLTQEQPTGPVQFGFINPGRSPGRLVIDGGLDFISGTILLEIQFNPLLNTFVTDELVFSNGSTLNLADANIVFSFLGATDPNAFFASGEWNLDTFFKTTSDPLFLPGNDQDISAILAPGETLDDLFSNSTFDAISPIYAFNEFSFTPDGGAISVDAVPKGSVPEPETLQLAVLALLLLAVARRYSRIARLRC